MSRLVSKKINVLLSALTDLDGKLIINAPMSRYTTMRVGGPALALYQPKCLTDLRDAIKLISGNNISLLAIGRGSNIIVKDSGTEKIVIKLSSPFFNKVKASDNYLICGGGVFLNKICYMAERNSLGGSEFLIGIPGTIAGAIVQNAGAHGSSISDIVRDISCVNLKGNIETLKRDEISFGYRESNLAKKIIVGVTLALKTKSRKKINSLLSSYVRERLSQQDYAFPSAGCIFKNPKGSALSAGELIDRCGLKGEILGGAYISDKHANFIVNRSKAKASEIIDLASIIRIRVKEKFNITLEEEVKIIN
ncbi:UDP-N-acetylmuramate dehydrogenase [Candidatus Omnitrophota bacterium]